MHICISLSSLGYPQILERPTWLMYNVHDHSNRTFTWSTMWIGIMRKDNYWKINDWTSRIVLVKKATEVFTQHKGFQVCISVFCLYLYLLFWILNCLLLPPNCGSGTTYTFTQTFSSQVMFNIASFLKLNRNLLLKLKGNHRTSHLIGCWFKINFPSLDDSIYLSTESCFGRGPRASSNFQLIAEFIIRESMIVCKSVFD
jgi:hypothetical protein